MRKTVTMAMMVVLVASIGMAANVTFTVNMAHQMANDNFDPASDYVDVAGDMNGWNPGEGEWQLAEDPSNTDHWIGTFAIDAGTYGFKFRINSSWEDGQHDGGDNRNLEVGDTDTEYFGYLNNFTMHPVVHFTVDLTDQFNNGNFDPAVDGVNIAGSFNGWDGAGFELSPTPTNDLIWEIYVDQDALFTVGEVIEFKFRINQNWENAEGIENRTLTIEDGLYDYTVFWNDFDYHVDPLTVTFTVNMAHQIANDNFDPAVDYVDVAGDMNGWNPGEGEWQLAEDPTNTDHWIGTFEIEPGSYGFKFRINSSWEDGQHDGGDNRVLVVVDENTEYFGYLNHFTMYPVVHFTVDLTDKFNNGTFDPAVDGVNIAGSFNGWDGAGFELSPTPGNDLVWEIYVDQDALFTLGETIEFKFRINQNWENAEGISNRTHEIVEGLQDYWAYWDDYNYNQGVTFEVNMNAMIDAGSFDPATQYIDMPGDFNGWSGGAGWTLTDDDEDGKWTLTVADSFDVGQVLEFKFRIDGDWEFAEFPGGSNRIYIVQEGANYYAVWWNDYDPNFEGANVTFQVNMNAQIDAENFDAAENNVYITGVFGDVLMADDDADGIYTLTEPMPVGMTFYRYSIDLSEDESLPFDRHVTVENAGEDVVLDVVWFSNVEEVSYGVGNVTFRVDMTVLQGLGFYDRALGDSLELRGDVNSWGSDPDQSIIDMIRQPGTEIYFLTVPYAGDAGDVFKYKFFLNLHEGATHAGEDFYEYELPASAGGGDRFFVWNGVDADTVMPVQTYQDYVTEGIIPEGESATAEFFIDMTAAMNLEDDPFDPETSELYFVHQDSWGADLQGFAAGTVPEDSINYQYVPAPEAGENVWKATITVNGPAPHAMIYSTKYINADDAGVSEVGSGMGFGRYRTQWFKPSSVGGDIAPLQAMSTVRWSNDTTPLEVEPEPYANGLVYQPVSVDEYDHLPSGFVLSQNYPNPFNPTTSISYLLPTATQVELVVFDITGREVIRLVDNKNHVAGRYDVSWNGLNAVGEKAASGLYFYRIIAGDFEQTQKMMLLK